MRLGAIATLLLLALAALVLRPADADAPRFASEPPILTPARTARPAPPSSTSIAAGRPAAAPDPDDAELARLLAGHDPCALWTFRYRGIWRDFSPAARERWLETALALAVDRVEDGAAPDIHDSLTRAAFAGDPARSIAILRAAPRNADSDFALALWLGGFMPGQAAPVAGEEAEVERLLAKVARDRPEDPTPVLFRAAWDAKRGRPRSAWRARIREAHERPGAWRGPLQVVREHLVARAGRSPLGDLLVEALAGEVDGPSFVPVRELLTPRELELRDAAHVDRPDPPIPPSPLAAWLSREALASCPDLPEDFTPPPAPVVEESCRG